MKAWFSTLTQRENLGSFQYWLIGWAIACFLGFVIAPFSTDQIPLAARLFYWVLNSACATILSYGVLQSTREANLSYWWQALLNSLIFAAIFTPILLLLDHYLLGEPVFLDFALFAIVFSISMAIYAIIYFANREAPPNKKTSSPLEQRLVKLRGKSIWSIEAQDHYIKVSANKESELVRMRFQDAIAALGDEGLQIHRSYWIAKEAIERITREDGDKYVVLKNGERFKVSKRRESLLRNI